MNREEAINKAIELEFGEGNSKSIRDHNYSIVKVAEHLYDLLQPSLPSNLDEAAENSWAVYEYRESPRGLYSTCYLDGFKSGAEWMAGQGVNADFGVCKLAGRAWLTPIDEKKFMQDIFGNFAAGDKVVVQIRKK